MINPSNEYPWLPLGSIVKALVASSKQRGLDLSLPIDRHYEPRDLLPYLGYDQRVKWQVVVEWRWLETLAAHGKMPPEHAQLLTLELLERLFQRVTTQGVTKIERGTAKKKGTGHDVLALLKLMRTVLPRELHRYLHLGLTSYDTICTAYALQMCVTMREVFWTKAVALDVLWRGHLAKYAETLQIGRTHLQDALPVTAGSWLAELHGRYVGAVREAREACLVIPGKMSGAVGTSAALVALFPNEDLETTALNALGLKRCVATQITPPEPHARFFHELVLVSGALANLGEDGRLLQSSAIGEIVSASSTSSTMSHKTANPIAAENVAGMHASVIGEEVKVMLTLVSDLHRDLRWSNVMRGFSAVMVLVYQQLLTAERLLRSLKVNEEMCRTNFNRNGRYVTAELLHLSLQAAGIPDAHALVNQRVVPLARTTTGGLATTMDVFAKRSRSRALREAWAAVPDQTKWLIEHPEEYLGHAVKIARDAACDVL